MRKYCVVTALIFTVCSVGGQTSTVNKDLQELLDGGAWIWGVTDNFVPRKRSQQLVIPTNEPDDDIEECKPYNPPVPEFKPPGRRISEAKCEEYIWNLKLKEEIKKRSEVCKIKQREKNWYKFPPGAVGGRETLPGEFPHMGAIGWRGSFGTWEFKCGGSLISPKFILTAAHCSSASSADTSLADPFPKIVRLGSKNINFALNTKTINKYDVNISRIIVHPDYKPPKKYYDIALMELELEVGFSQYLQPACLWGQRDFSKLGTIATLTGWGVLQEGSTKISEELQAAVIDVLDDKLCDRLLAPFCNRNWCGVQDHQVCAGKLAGGVDACQGDSGGPLQVEIVLDFRSPYRMYHVIGVTSFGIGCAQPDTPGIYTRVSSFIDWIEQIVWP